MKQTIGVMALVLAAGLALVQTAPAQQMRKEIRVYTSSDQPRGGWLGVGIQDISSKLEKKKGLKSDEGAYVTEVVDDSPADSAGIKEGDVIVEFNGRKIDDADELLHAVQKAKPGMKTSIIVMRNNEKKSLDIAVGKNRAEGRKEAFAFTPPAAPRIAMFTASQRWGLQLSELNEQLGAYFGAPNGHGLLVERVEKKSNGAKAGFKAGDVITKINTTSVEDLRDLSDALEDAEGGDKISVEILRKGSTQTLTVETDEDDDAPSSFNDEFDEMPEGTMTPDFTPGPMPSVDMDRLRMEIQRSLPNMDEWKGQLDELRKSMTRIKV